MEVDTSAGTTAGPSKSTSPSAAVDAKPSLPANSTTDVEMGNAEAAAKEEDDDKENAEEKKPEGFNVVYINNLNEKVKLPVLKSSLTTLFREYGKVLGVTLHKNVRMRGQAFVTLASKEAAAKAVEEVKGFPLYGKPMQLAFAKTRSDALVKKEDAEHFDEHKADRLIRKKKNRRDNPLRRKELAKKIAAKQAAETSVATGIAAPAPAASAARKVVEMPDEYLPPNKILFVQNLPEDTTKEALEQLFRPYPNLTEVRTIPGRKNIAFVEFSDDASSTVAKEALHNSMYGQPENQLKLKVNFAKLG